MDITEFCNKIRDINAFLSNNKDYDIKFNYICNLIKEIECENILRERCDFLYHQRLLGIKTGLLASKNIQVNNLKLE